MRFRLFPRSRRNQILLLAVLVGIGVAAWKLYGPLKSRYELRRGKQFFELRDYDTALSHFQSAADVRPESAEAQFWLARTYRKQGRFDLTRKHLKRADALGLSPERLQREQWLALAQSGQMSQAEPYLQQLLVEPRDDGREILEAFVRGYLLISRHGPAEALLAAWKKDFPNDAQPHFLEGLIQAERQNHPPAVAAFRRSLDRQSHRDDVRLELGKSLLAMHEHEEAEQIFRDCLQRSPDNPDAKLNLARSLIPRQRVAAARQVLKSIIEVDARHVEARVELAQLALDDGDAPAALNWLQPVAAANPRHLRLREILASALRATGDRARAKAHADYVRAAKSAYARIRNLQQEVRKNPRAIQPRFEIGRLRLEYGPQIEAPVWLHGVLDIDANHQAANALLADYYESKGRTALAKKYRGRFEQRTPAKTNK